MGAEVRYVGPDHDGALRSGVRGHVIETTAGRTRSFRAGGRQARVSRGQVRIAVADGTTAVARVKDLELVTPPHVLRPERDAAAARWLLEELRPWTSGDQMLPVASFVPESYAAVVKILHPWAGKDEHAVVPWQQVMAVAQLPSLHALSRTRSMGGPPQLEGWQSPAQGRLDQRTAAGLVAVLQSATDTPANVFVGVWTGWGGFPYQRFPGAAVIPTEARGHRLLRGPLTGVLQPVSDRSDEVETSGIWWPADRAWVVVTEIDFEWTFVAGSEALVEELASHPDLEVLRTDMDAPANRLDQDRPV
ncbi:MAG TPA: hypothetical protein VMM13_08560 [Euzebya sp.]|nr:hypothetical protein [Euzebya sp.]